MSPAAELIKINPTDVRSESLIERVSSSRRVSPSVSVSTHDDDSIYISHSNSTHSHTNSHDSVI